MGEEKWLGKRDDAEVVTMTYGYNSRVTGDRDKVGRAVERENGESGWRLSPIGKSEAKTRIDISEKKYGEGQDLDDWDPHQ